MEASYNSFTFKPPKHVGSIFLVVLLLNKCDLYKSNVASFLCILYTEYIISNDITDCYAILYK